MSIGPIVAVTASAMPDQLAAMRDVGFDDLLTRPLEPATLRALVRRFDKAGTAL